MQYEFFTESLTIGIESPGRRGSIRPSDAQDPSSKIRDRFNELSAEGWEFLQIADIPLTGQTLKSGAHRVIAVAVFRRPITD